MTYRAPVDEYLFLLDVVHPITQVFARPRFAHQDAGIAAPVLTEAAHIAERAFAPLRRAGDYDPARLENGVVRTTRGFAEAYHQYAEGGWIGLAADAAHGGMQLPQSLNMAVNEMLSGANLSLQLLPLLSQGQIEALAHHADDAIRALYLPKLISGRWSGTMNLTEPQAGSDVGALTTRAEPLGDGRYAITGQKIFISWADADFLENTVHLVLARLPGAPAGSRGISLFLVPKYLPTPEDSAGARNGLRVLGLEHKMGLHGSPTAVLDFAGATGWMVGPANGGLAAMFTMMNNARLGVGMQGIGVAEGAFQQALAFATQRRQGRAGGSGTIAEHADVRRMLASMKADIFAARAIALACAHAGDMATDTTLGEVSGHHAARAAFLTPIAKAFGTDTGIAVANEAIQVHGGMGFVEETGVAQFLRDVRVTAIYEGTNGIQAMDLVGRKFLDGGDAAFRLIDEIEGGAEAARLAFPDLARSVWGAAETLREATEWMVAQGDMNERLAGAQPFLRAFARVLGAHYHLRAACTAEAGARRARTALARHYMVRLLPEHAALLDAARQGKADLFALDLADLAA
ncbi:acyl-CoA dehydrogenase [Palleronia sp. KMU-117]|uniref:acyl-CoA dehydrogenase n=1 Tax=Palleronia sp. KMU-117 TaxID=3434108 RepID=UPI003D7368C8